MNPNTRKAIQSVPVLFRKAAVIFTAACFLLTAVCGQALAVLAQEDRITAFNEKPVEDFALPNTIGRITGACDKGSDIVVVAVQDLHCHPEAQRNIASILTYLRSTYKAETVYLEGTWGKTIDTGWLRCIADEKMRRSIIDGLVENGELTGVEKFAAEFPEVAVRGLEDEKLYKENSLRLKAIAEGRETADAMAAEVEEAVKAAGKNYLNARQNKLEGLMARHRSGKLESGKYYSMLLKFGRGIGIEEDSYPNLRGYLGLLETEKRIQYRKVSRELKTLVGELRRTLPYAAYQALAEHTDNFRQLDRFYLQFGTLQKHHPVNLQKYPALGCFFRYLETGRQVNPLELLKEERGLIKELEFAMAEDKSQEEVVFLCGFARVLNDFYANRITAEDYAYFTGNYEEFEMLYQVYTGKNTISRLAPYYALYHDYYEANIKRNECFAANIIGDTAVGKLAALPGTEEGRVCQALHHAKRISVVVTGGFHTEGLTGLLAEKGVSTLTITPNITESTKESDTVYARILARQNKVLSQAFAAAALSMLGENEQLAPMAGIALRDYFQAFDKGRISREQIDKELNAKIFKDIFAYYNDLKTENPGLHEHMTGTLEIFGLNEEKLKKSKVKALRFEGKDGDSENYLFSLAMENGDLKRYSCTSGGIVTLLAETETGKSDKVSAGGKGGFANLLALFLIIGLLAGQPSAGGARYTWHPDFAGNPDGKGSVVFKILKDKKQKNYDKAAEYLKNIMRRTSLTALMVPGADKIIFYGGILIVPEYPSVKTALDKAIEAGDNSGAAVIVEKVMRHLDQLHKAHRAGYYDVKAALDSMKYVEFKNGSAEVRWGDPLCIEIDVPDDRQGSLKQEIRGALLSYIKEKTVDEERSELITYLVGKKDKADAGKTWRAKKEAVERARKKQVDRLLNRIRGPWKADSSDISVNDAGTVIKVHGFFVADAMVDSVTAAFDLIKEIKTNKVKKALLLNEIHDVSPWRDKNDNDRIKVVIMPDGPTLAGRFYECLESGNMKDARMYVEKLKSHLKQLEKTGLGYSAGPFEILSAIGPAYYGTNIPHKNEKIVCLDIPYLQKGIKKEQALEKITEALGIMGYSEKQLKGLGLNPAKKKGDLADAASRIVPVIIVSLLFAWVVMPFVSSYFHLSLPFASCGLVAGMIGTKGGFFFSRNVLNIGDDEPDLPEENENVRFWGRDPTKDAESKFITWYPESIKHFEGMMEYPEIKITEPMQQLRDEGVLYIGKREPKEEPYFQIVQPYYKDLRSVLKESIVNNRHEEAARLLESAQCHFINLSNIGKGFSYIDPSQASLHMVSVDGRVKFNNRLALAEDDTNIEELMEECGSLRKALEIAGERRLRRLKVEQDGLRKTLVDVLEEIYADSGQDKNRLNPRSAIESAADYLWSSTCLYQPEDFGNTVHILHNTTGAGGKNVYLASLRTELYGQDKMMALLRRYGTGSIDNAEDAAAMLNILVASEELPGKMDIGRYLYDLDPRCKKLYERWAHYRDVKDVLHEAEAAKKRIKNKENSGKRNGKKGKSESPDKELADLDRKTYHARQVQRLTQSEMLQLNNALLKLAFPEGLTLCDKNNTGKGPLPGMLRAKPVPPSFNEQPASEPVKLDSQSMAHQVEPVKETLINRLNTARGMLETESLEAVIKVLGTFADIIEEILMGPAVESSAKDASAETEPVKDADSGSEAGEPDIVPVTEPIPESEQVTISELTADQAIADTSSEDGVETAASVSDDGSEQKIIREAGSVPGTEPTAEGSTKPRRERRSRNPKFHGPKPGAKPATHREPAKNPVLTTPSQESPEVRSPEQEEQERGTRERMKGRYSGPWSGVHPEQLPKGEIRYYVRQEWIQRTKDAYELINEIVKNKKPKLINEIAWSDEPLLEEDGKVSVVIADCETVAQKMAALYGNGLRERREAMLLMAQVKIHLDQLEKFGLGYNAPPEEILGAIGLLGFGRGKSNYRIMCIDYPYIQKAGKGVSKEDTLQTIARALALMGYDARQIEAMGIIKREKGHGNNRLSSAVSVLLPVLLVLMLSLITDAVLPGSSAAPDPGLSIKMCGDLLQYLHLAFPETGMALSVLGMVLKTTVFSDDGNAGGPSLTGFTDLNNKTDILATSSVDNNVDILLAEAARGMCPIAVAMGPSFDTGTEDPMAGIIRYLKGRRIPLQTRIKAGNTIFTPCAKVIVDGKGNKAVVLELCRFLIDSEENISMTATKDDELPGDVLVVEAAQEIFADLRKEKSALGEEILRNVPAFDGVEKLEPAILTINVPVGSGATVRPGAEDMIVVYRPEGITKKARVKIKKDGSMLSAADCIVVPEGGKELIRSIFPGIDPVTVRECSGPGLVRSMEGFLLTLVPSLLWKRSSNMITGVRPGITFYEEKGSQIQEETIKLAVELGADVQLEWDETVEWEQYEKYMKKTSGTNTRLIIAMRASDPSSINEKAIRKLARAGYHFRFDLSQIDSVSDVRSMLRVREMAPGKVIKLLSSDENAGAVREICGEAGYLFIEKIALNDNVPPATDEVLVSLELKSSSDRFDSTTDMGSRLEKFFAAPVSEVCLPAAVLRGKLDGTGRSFAKTSVKKVLSRLLEMRLKGVTEYIIKKAYFEGRNMPMPGMTPEKRDEYLDRLRFYMPYIYRNTYGIHHGIAPAFHALLRAYDLQWKPGGINRRMFEVSARSGFYFKQFDEICTKAGLAGKPEWQPFLAYAAMLKKDAALGDEQAKITANLKLMQCIRGLMLNMIKAEYSNAMDFERPGVGELWDWLLIQGDSFIVKKPDLRGPAIDAQYNTFCERSFSRMCSLPGLLLSTGRTDEAKSMLLNIIGTGNGHVEEKIEYSNEEWQLMFVENLWQYRERTGENLVDFAVSTDKGKEYPVRTAVRAMFEKFNRYYLNNEMEFVSCLPGLTGMYYNAARILEELDKDNAEVYAGAAEKCRKMAARWVDENDSISASTEKKPLNYEHYLYSPVMLVALSKTGDLLTPDRFKKVMGILKAQRASLTDRSGRHSADELMPGMMEFYMEALRREGLSSAELADMAINFAYRVQEKGDLSPEAVAASLRLLQTFAEPKSAIKVIRQDLDDVIRNTRAVLEAA